MNHALKSIGAVLAGIVVTAAPAVATDAILEGAGIFPNASQGLFITWMLALALAYRCVYTIAGGYVTAWLAPDRPMRHAIILGSIGTVLACVGVVVGWDLSQHWYPIALVVTGIPCTWLGAKLRGHQRVLSHMPR